MSALRKLLNPERDWDPSSSYRPPTLLLAKSSSRRLSSSRLEEGTSTSDDDPPLSVMRDVAPPPPTPPPPDHVAHQDCPDTLACLPDTEGRPQHTLPVILRCAILGSPRKRLTIREIYNTMEKKYPYYKTAGPTWKQSVRHHLSLNRLFEKQPRPPTDPGFGSYWTVNLEAPPGTKRPRKRGRPKQEGDLTETETLPVKKRGRPKKEVVDVSLPMKDSVPGALGSGEESNVEDELKLESEEDIALPYEHAQARAQARAEKQRRPTPSIAITPIGTPTVSTPAPSTSSLPTASLSASSSSMASTSLDKPPTHEYPTNYLDRLVEETVDLRKQCAEAVSVSLRLTSQLADAHAEVSNVRATLRLTEADLQEERRRRSDAELKAEYESRLRRATEDTLRAIRNMSPRNDRNSSSPR